MLIYMILMRGGMDIPCRWANSSSSLSRESLLTSRACMHRSKCSSVSLLRMLKSLSVTLAHE